MSLGLVCYDDSEESDNEVDSEAAADMNVSSFKNPSSLSGTVTVDADRSGLQKGNSPVHFVDEETEPIREFEKPVQLHIPQSKISSLNTDIDIKCLTSTNKRSGPVKITIPSLNEVEDDAEPPSKKKLKPSQKGSGLFALLPNPKSSLVPQSVVNKHRSITNKKLNVPTKKCSKPVPKIPVVNKSSLITYEDSGDEDESPENIDFFSLERKEEVVIPAPVEIDLSLPEVNHSPVQSVPLKDNRADDISLNFPPFTGPTTSSSLPSSSFYHQPASQDQYTSEEFMSVSNNDLQLDQEAMQQLCGRRDRLKMQEVNIIDVSGDAIMPDSREWLTKQLTEEQTHMTSHKKKDGPTTQQKRKHQITYLAFQAKENELELKNQWANNRMSRKQTQAKYGF